MFNIGMTALCIYSAVIAWHPFEEEVKEVGINCKVLEVSDMPAFGKGYQHLRLDCTEGLKTVSNLSKTSKLNHKVVWLDSDKCHLDPNLYEIPDHSVAKKSIATPWFFGD